MKNIFFNSWIKTALVMLFCFFGTYIVLAYFSADLRAMVDFRSKAFWTAAVFAVPAAFLFPTMLNGFFFLRVTQIADETKKTRKLIEEQNELLKHILDKQK